MAAKDDIYDHRVLRAFKFRILSHGVPIVLSDVCNQRLHTQPVFWQRHSYA